jgi:DNA modification methylase
MVLLMTELFHGDCLDTNTNRNFIGIEKDEKYFNIAKQRIESHSPDNTGNVEDIVKKQRLF